MFVTKQIINEKVKRSLLPHKKQILKQIHATLDDENWKIDRFYTNSTYSRPKSCHSRMKRPKTAITIKPSSVSKDMKTESQTDEQTDCIYLKKVNYQFNEINEISNLFDSVYECGKKKENKLKKENILLSDKINSIKRKISIREKQQRETYDKMKRILTAKVSDTTPNIYMGFSKQKVKKVIPISIAKHQDINMLARYIKGGYVEEAEEFSNKQSKTELIKLKKRFVTMNTLYDGIKGNRSKGIQNMKPESVDRSSLQNLVYYLENQKNLKLQDKLAIQQKINIIL